MEISDLGQRIVKQLGQQGSMSLKALTVVLRPQEPKTIEAELKTLTRRKLIEQPFEGSNELTDKGRKQYEEMVKHVPSVPPGRERPGLERGIGLPWEGEHLFPADEEDFFEDEEEECEDCGELIEDCICDEEGEDDDDYDY